MHLAVSIYLNFHWFTYLSTIPSSNPYLLYTDVVSAPYEHAPMPAPGPALLDDQESNMLDSFFTTINSDYLYPTDLYLGNQHSKPLGPPLNLGLAGDLPPTFKGSASYIPQQQSPSQLHGGFSNMGGPFISTGDLLAASSMLYSNNYLAKGGLSSLGHEHFLGHTPPRSTPSYNNQPKKTHETPKTPLPYHTSEMLFDVHHPVLPEQQPKKNRTLQFGSDASFMNHGYLPSRSRNVEANRLLEYMRCLEPQSSTPNTRPGTPDRSSPVPRSANIALPDPNDTVPFPSYSPIENSRQREEDEEDAQPRKRQKIDIKPERGEEDYDEVNVSQQQVMEEEVQSLEGSSPKPRRRRSKASGSVSSCSTGRRGSNEDGSSSRKAKQSQKERLARENLTEEQKRANHIQSEQKRRNLIRTGFDELCSLVPSL